ncbi:DUF6082 family protein [Streptomyces sp. NPDC048436]|uniref:DUF6082 family protein n=1 Tax=Streptomyces sp. NPDC048436 TaxID=3365550 RepID=UPI0037207B17
MSQRTERLGVLSVAVISLVVSVAALVAAGLSLVYQAQQTRLVRDESMRNHHRELLAMALDDPDLRVSWGGTIAELPEETARQSMFANLIVTWWNSGYMIKDMSDGQLSLLLDSFFRGEVGREYWGRAGQGWRDAAQLSKSKRQKRFVSIVEAKYQSALAVHS